MNRQEQKEIRQLINEVSGAVIEVATELEYRNLMSPEQAVAETAAEAAAKAKKK